MIDAFWLLMRVLFILNVFFAIVIVIYERKNPAVTWAWLMVLLFVPYFGFIAYLLLGLDSNKHRIFLFKAKNDNRLYDEYRAHTESLTKDQLQMEKGLYDLVHLNSFSGNAPITTASEIFLFHEGNSMMDLLFSHIQRAKSYIHIQYYIIRDDELGKKFIKALTEKAKEGIQVKLLYDSMGCFSTPKSFFNPLKVAGGEVCAFIRRDIVRINYRNHRKICVIDGQIGYIGGLNIGDEYLGKTKRFGYWRDSHICVYGQAVQSLSLRFIMDWNFASRTQIDMKDYLFPLQENQVEQSKIEQRKVQNKVEQNQVTMIQKQALHLHEQKEMAKGKNKNKSRNKNIQMQIVSSGPDTKWNIIHHSYIKLINEANKSICIQTPYFVPDDSIFEALKIAALSGIDVKIIFPARPDHPFVYWAALSYLGELIKAGVKCYKYERGFVHSKLLLIDSHVTSVGTANMDVRSFKLNFEINALIYNEEVTRSFESEFYKDLAYCTRITEEGYNQRSGLTKIKEAISRLLSPLL